MQKTVTVLMSADVVEFGRMVAANEDGAIARLAACRTLILQHVARCGGEAFNVGAEGVLARFPGASNAIRCALNAQNALERLRNDVPDGHPMQFRFGLVIGEVTDIEGDVIGPGVTMALKLQTLAPVGGVAVSAAFREQVDADLPALFVSAGSHELKAGTEPVEVFVTSPGAPAKKPAARAAKPRKVRAASGLSLVTVAKNVAIAGVVGAAVMTSVTMFVGANIALVQAATEIQKQIPPAAIKKVGIATTATASKPEQVAVDRPAIAPAPTPRAMLPSEKVQPLPPEPPRPAVARVTPAAPPVEAPKAAEAPTAPKVTVAEAKPAILGEPDPAAGPVAPGKSKKAGGLAPGLKRIAEKYLDCSRCDERKLTRKLEKWVGKF